MDHRSRGQVRAAARSGQAGFALRSRIALRSRVAFGSRLPLRPGLTPRPRLTLRSRIADDARITFGSRLALGTSQGFLHFGRRVGDAVVDRAAGVRWRRVRVLDRVDAAVDTGAAARGDGVDHQPQALAGLLRVPVGQMRRIHEQRVAGQDRAALVLHVPAYPAEHKAGQRALAHPPECVAGGEADRTVDDREEHRRGGGKGLEDVVPDLEVQAGTGRRLFVSALSRVGLGVGNGGVERVRPREMARRLDGAVEYVVRVGDLGDGAGDPEGPGCRQRGNGNGDAGQDSQREDQLGREALHWRAPFEDVRSVAEIDQDTINDPDGRVRWRSPLRSPWRR